MWELFFLSFIEWYHLIRPWKVKNDRLIQFITEVPLVQWIAYKLRLRTKVIGKIVQFHSGSFYSSKIWLLSFCTPSLFNVGIWKNNYAHKQQVISLVSPGLVPKWFSYIHTDFKTRLSAKPLIWKWFFILIYNSFKQERLCTWPHFALKVTGGGEGQEGESFALFLWPPPPSISRLTSHFTKNEGKPPVTPGVVGALP